MKVGIKSRFLCKALALIMIFCGMGYTSGQPIHAEESGSAADKSVLSDLIAQAEQVDLNGRSAESAAFFQSAVAAAKETEADASASQQRVNSQSNLLIAASGALLEQADENAVYNGSYSIDGIMRHASQDQDSMGNAALVKPMELIVNNGTLTLRMEFQALTAKLGVQKFTGYLAELTYFPDWEEDALPDGETPMEANVESWHDGVYDEYNDPETGSVENLRGELYPHYMTIPVNLNDAEIWVQVYVPVMEAISPGSGRQYARLQLDWSSLTQLSGTETDHSLLEQRIAEAEAALSEAEKEESGFSAAQIAVLQTGIAAGRAVLANMNVDQEAVNATAKALFCAVNIFQEEERADTSELESLIASADAYLADSGKYSSAAVSILRSEREKAAAVLADAGASQSTVDAQAAALKTAIQNMTEVPNTSVDKSSLHMMILSATSIAGRSSYTASSLSSLKNCIAAAEAVYQDENATQEEVDAQVSALSLAIVNMTEKTTEASGSTPNNGGNNGDNASGDDDSEGDEDLDIHNLKDGTYSISGTMVKTDKKTASMANDAISHTIELTVKNGNYSLTLNFKGLTINSQKGYLSKLKYFKTGYTTDKYGVPKGSLKSVTVNSYQKDSDGNVISDSLGTDYPDKVTFPLIPEALEDGYVPLQVFVPIMESISSGSGTQAVYLKLNLNSLKAASSDDFDDEDEEDEDDDDTTTPVTTSSSLLTAASTLPKTGSSLSGTNTLSGSSSVKAASSGTGSGSSLKSGAGGSSLKENKADLTAGNVEEALSQAAAVSQSDTGTASETSAAAVSDTADEEGSPLTIPSVTSFLAVVLGVLYKIKSRRIFG